MTGSACEDTAGGADGWRGLAEEGTVAAADPVTAGEWVATEGRTAPEEKAAPEEHVATEDKAAPEEQVAPEDGAAAEEEAAAEDGAAAEERAAAEEQVAAEDRAAAEEGAAVGATVRVASVAKWAATSMALTTVAWRSPGRTRREAARWARSWSIRAMQSSNRVSISSCTWTSLPFRAGRRAATIQDGSGKRAPRRGEWV
ncbi:hypothetical protein Axi01nite_64100 [Actinoplanes xinjiangensis]|nr:hypothetical protein Axi01nite_64100 [Actinoplanes xinjiangensis]